MGIFYAQIEKVGIFGHIRSKLRNPLPWLKYDISQRFSFGCRNQKYQNYMICSLILILEIEREGSASFRISGVRLCIRLA